MNTMPSQNADTASRRNTSAPNVEKQSVENTIPEEENSCTQPASKDIPVQNADNTLMQVREN